MTDRALPESSFPPFAPTSQNRRGKLREETPAPVDASSAWLDRHWAKLAWGLASGLAVIGYITGTIGIHVSGPPNAIAALAHEDTIAARERESIMGRVTRLEQRADRVETALTFQSYLLCVNNRGSDQRVLDRCRTIIQTQSTR